MTRTSIWFCVKLPLDDEGRAFIHDVEGEAEVEGHDWENADPSVGIFNAGYTAVTVEAIEVDGVSIKGKTPVAVALWSAVVDAIEYHNGADHVRAINELNAARHAELAEAKAAAHDKWEAHQDYLRRAAKESLL